MPRAPPIRGRGRPRGRSRGIRATRAENRQRNTDHRAGLTDEQRAELNSVNRERMAAARDQLTEGEREDINRANRENMAAARGQLTDEERIEINERRSQIRAGLPEQERQEMNRAARENMAAVRDQLTEEERDEMNRANRENMAAARDHLTEGEREEMNRVDRERRAAARGQLTEEEREDINRRNREAMADTRDRVNRVHIQATARSFLTNPPIPFTLGMRNNLCKYGCRALLFRQELDSGHCCSKGKVNLESAQRLQPYNEELKILLLGEHPHSNNFFQYIRRYNSAVSFASMGAQTAFPPGNGPYCFRIHGAVHHRTGLLHPEPGDDRPRTFGQIYILEGDGALQTRLNNNSETFRDVMFLLQRTLEECNPYSVSYKNLHAIEQEEANTASAQDRQPDTVRMVFRAGPDRRRYNAPTTDDVAVVFVGNDGMPGQQDFCVYPKSRDALHKIPGTLYTVRSTDTLSGPVDGINLNELHDLTPSGFPLHDLHLKESQGHKACNVRLLKVVDRYPDLAIGSRLKIIKINEAEGNIICKHNDQQITLYRENFVTQHQQSTFIRYQFPLKLETFLEHMSSLNHNLDPLVYPIFFHKGETGYYEAMKQQGGNRRVSMLQFYAYRLAYREEPFSPLHYGRKLFQQYVVDAWVRTESNRLNFPQQNQNRLRTDLYTGLIEHLENQRQDPGYHQPGRPLILPSSFTGGPRYMKQMYDDAMAMVTEFGKPDFFVTYTCNPKHCDIENNLGNHATSPHRPARKLEPPDRPDIVASVFKLHLDQLKKDLRKMFGKELANIHVIEYQKRGLPHAHILVWLTSEAKPRTPADIDGLISAEIPDPALHPELHRIVTSCMMHGPCGTANTRAPCMENGKCSKQFPKTYQEQTLIEVNGYPMYQRSNNGRFIEKNGVTLDNRYVIPYCPYLTLKYNAHINVEACTSIKSIKYIFKYVYKGHDCARVERSEVDNNTHNEIKDYIDARYVSAPESMWRLNGFDICHKSHTVVRLDVHEENRQSVVFPEEAGEAGIEAALDGNHTTKLTAWFKLNTDDSSANQYLYTEIPKHYCWDTTNRSKKWKKRRNNTGRWVVSRMYSVHPRQRERFYLRVLLLHVRGAKSFRDIKTYEGVTYDTFEQTCRARDLLIDDTEWQRTLQEASIYASPRQIRELFVTILGNSEPSNPKDLWEEFKGDMCEDFIHHHELTQQLAEQYALREINGSLLSNYRVTVATFGLDLVEGLPDIDNAANEINVESEAENFEGMYRLLTEEQRLIADTIISDLETYEDRSSTDRPRVYFTDAPGGTGKTHVCNTLIAKALSMGLKVASCAWTGIAGNLLRFGQTVHSLTKLPVPILETSTCNIAPNSQQAEFIRSLSMIFIDEASMVPLHALTAIDRMLRDITGSSVPFGGKLLMFAGDFRQTLPVIPRAQPAAILENCINRSPLWQHFTQLQLTQNMRALPGEEEFCRWLIELGDGHLQSQHPNALPGQIDIPTQCNITSNVVESVYPDLNVDCSDSIILAPKNVDTHVINMATLARFKPDEMSRSYYSTDNYLEDDNDDHLGLPAEFLHSQTPSGLPLHHLELKVGCPIMLLRNLDVNNGLCNGTRLKVLRLGDRCIEAEIVSGSQGQIGRSVFIPRIKLSPSDSSLPFKFQRTQFPVRLCYCMTINKSQGQTFRKVGLYLPEPVFSHGQLYVGCSRARSFRDIYVQITNTTQQYATNNQGITMNVVFDINAPL